MTSKHGLLTVIICLLAAMESLAQTAATPSVLSPKDEIELKTLSGQLSDASRDAKTKLEAATLLLTKPYPQAADALKGFLADNSNRPAQTAVAEAISQAQIGGDQKAFIEPLLAMLTGTDATVREPAGRALAAIKDSTVKDKLIAISSDATKDRAVRQAAVVAMQRIMDKDVVEALINLLGDNEDPGIRSAAEDSLAQLTKIRHFKNNREQWIIWWRQNKNKDQAQWLADQTAILGQANASLEQSNRGLRTRLAKAMIDLYNLTPAASRDAMLLNFMKDQLEDVRLVSLDLLNRNIEGGSQVAAEIKSHVRTMLTDGDDRVRQESARLIAALGDAEALTILLERLKTETVPSVRQGILMALGQLRDPKAMPVVLGEINAKHEDVAAAAAIALSKIVAKTTLDEQTRSNAAGVLVERYNHASKAAGDASLREALLAAMADIGDKTSAVSILEAALKDEAATVRLAAVTGLAQLGSSASAAAMEKLVVDKDRGVRGAVLAAMRNLCGEKYLFTILERTDPANEEDPATRQQAWDHVNFILAKADAKALREVSDKLAARKDASAQRIKVMQMLVALHRQAGSADLPASLRDVGVALAKCDRYTEAATNLGEAYKLLNIARSDSCNEVWAEWMDALVAADDPAAVKLLGEQTAAEQVAKGIKSIDARLTTLTDKQNWQAVIVLSDAMCKLGACLTDEQKRKYLDTLSGARLQQLDADRQRVAKLAGQLASADEALKKAALVEIQTLGDRAVEHLLKELKAAVEADKAGAATEQGILEALRQVAPKLKVADYDVSAPKDARLKLIAGWTPKN